MMVWRMRRFVRCLKVGMNPALLDKSLKVKNIKKIKTKDDELSLIDNLEELEHSDIVSNMLMVLNMLFVNKCEPFSISGFIIQNSKGSVPNYSFLHNLCWRLWDGKCFSFLKNKIYILKISKPPLQTPCHCTHRQSALQHPVSAAAAMVKMFV